jgi:hypothetical protein
MGGACDVRGQSACMCLNLFTSHRSEAMVVALQRSFSFAMTLGACLASLAVGFTLRNSLAESSWGDFSGTVLMLWHCLSILYAGFR